MAIEVGETVKIRVTWTDEAEAPLDPDSQEWKIYDQDGVLKETFTEADLTKEGTGIYYVYYDVPESAESSVWKAVCKATKLAKVGYVTKHFSIHPR